MNDKNITAKTCLSCGACCVAPRHQGSFADVYEVDLKRLDKKFVKLHVLKSRPFDILANRLDGNVYPDAAIKTSRREMKAGPLKGHELNTCVALIGDVMAKVKCSIYKDRPDVCHTAVVPGDNACRALRKAMK